ncbi:MAG: nuclear transport factor 2 family protein [Deferrisomatales bacterium]|nr:nuclear transport factor 2 family protein [Deferrisomatales bacterium]
MNDFLNVQVQWLVDRAHISDLLYRFASCLDNKDYQGYAANFVDGGYVEIPEPTSTSGETFRMPKEKMPELMPHGLGKYTGTHHLSTNHQIEIEGDSATSRSYLQAVHVGPTPFDHWDGGGWYDCTYRRTPEGWRFVTVKLSVLWITGNPVSMKAGA